MYTFLLLKSLIIFLSCPCNFCNEISIVSGVYWSQLPETVIYQSSVPLTYYSEFALESKPEEKEILSTESCENSSEEMCRLATFADHLNTMFSKHLQVIHHSMGPQRVETTEAHNRKSRAIEFIGEALNWCCGVVTENSIEPLFANEENIKKVIGTLEFTLNQEHEDLVQVLGSIRNYSSQTNSVLTNTRNYAEAINSELNRLREYANKRFSAQNDEIGQLWKILIQNSLQKLEFLKIFNKYEILNGCRDNKIPTEIINPIVLERDLKKLDRVLSTHGHELVIRPDDVSRYLRLSIATCFATENSIMVTLQLPVRKTDYSWKLYRLISVPFAWQEKTCLFTQEEVLIAKHVDEIRIITGTALKFCNLSEKLCLLPRSSSTSARDKMCFHKLAEGAQISELIRACQPNCFANNDTVIVQVEPEKFIIKHAPHKMKLVCNDKEKIVKVTNELGYGSLEVEVPCACTLKTEDKILVSDTYPCDYKGLQEFSIRHVLPAIWSKFHTFKLKPLATHTHLTFENFSECLNTTWDRSLPEFMAPEIKSVPLQDTDLKFEHVNWGRVKYSWNLINIVNTGVTILTIVITIRNPYLLGFTQFQRVEAVDWNVIITDTSGCIILVATLILIIWWVYKLLVLRKNKNVDVQIGQSIDVETQTQQAASKK